MRLDHLPLLNTTSNSGFWLFGNCLGTKIEFMASCEIIITDIKQICMKIVKKSECQRQKSIENM